MKSLFYLIWGWLLTTTLFACSGNASDTNQHQPSAQASRLYEQGQKMEQASRHKEAMQTYWDALEVLKTEKNAKLEFMIYNQLGKLWYRFGIYEKATQDHRKGYLLAKQLKDRSLESEALTRLYLEYTALGQQDTAQHFLNLYQAVLDTTPHLKHSPAPDTLVSLARSDKAFPRLPLSEREKLLAWETTYKQQQALLQQEREKNRQQAQQITYLVFSLIVLLLLATLYWVNKRAARRRAKAWKWFHELLDKNQQLLTDYQEKLAHSTANIHRLQAALEQNRHSTEASRELTDELTDYRHLEEQLKAYIETERTRRSLLLSEESTRAVLLINQMKRKPTYSPIKRESDWQALFNFAHALCDRYPEQMDRVDGLTSRDRQLCCLIALHFTTGQLAVFYGISPESMTKAKYRLQKKIEAAGIDTHFLQ